MLPAAMDDTPAAVASTKPRSTDFSIAAIMSKEISKNQSSSPGVGNDSPTKDKHCTSIDNNISDYNHNRNNHHHHRNLFSTSNESHRGLDVSETEDFSDSDGEKDIDICDDDNKVTSSSVETPGSVKDFEDDDTCSVGGGDRCSPGANSPGPDDSSAPPPATTNRSSKKSSKSKKVEMKGRCNDEELLQVHCHLETKELWDKFHDLGTEMIITKRQILMID
ncbi:T-box protein H15 [Folsomia candida]|uniref:T-box protein H15 n=1 Tax=Folsomia candida TaxID=158441 RepID=A0A226F0S1_FOLCA|nr:T-box protein H15 [Folsomia candida]